MPDNKTLDIGNGKSGDQLVSIQIAKDYLGFSAGHFTIFSATRRERLHGHSFRLRAEIVATVDDNGLTFDYGPVKRALKALCDELDERLLLPSQSPHLQIKKTSKGLDLCFNKEVMTLPADDVLVLPIRNVTVEELSQYFLQRLLSLTDIIAISGLHKLTIGVSSGSGQWGQCHWTP